MVKRLRTTCIFFFLSSFFFPLFSFFFFSLWKWHEYRTENSSDEVVILNADDKWRSANCCSLRFSGRGNQGKGSGGKFRSTRASQTGILQILVFPKKFTNEIQSILEFEADGMRTTAWKGVERPRVR